MRPVDGWQRHENMSTAESADLLCYTLCEAVVVLLQLDDGIGIGSQQRVLFRK